MVGKKIIKFNLFMLTANYFNINMYTVMLMLRYFFTIF